jgi:chitodextrinase
MVLEVLTNDAPVVNLRTPRNNEEIGAGESVSIEVAAYDDGVVDSVEFFVNGLKIGVDSSPVSDSLFSIEWISQQGTAKIKAVATDERGLSGDADSVSISVVNVHPLLTITSPENGETFLSGSEVTISVNASDPDGSIDSVQFMLNSASLAILSSEPYEVKWTATEGSYTIKAIAFDNDGASTETTVRITVSDASGISNSESRHILVYPNPVHHILYMDISAEVAEDIKQVHLIDLSGRPILQMKGEFFNNTSSQVDLTGLGPGLYILMLEGSENIYTYRITKY